MAENSAKAVNMARNLAITHLIVGILLVCFGIADRVIEYSLTGFLYFGIWIGAWVCITGALGIMWTTFKKQSIFQHVYADCFKSFSVIAALLGGIIIIFYGIYIGFSQGHSNVVIAITSITLILGIVELVTGIMASGCICTVNPPRQRQVTYNANAPFDLIQRPSGVPVILLQAQTFTTGTPGTVTGAEGYQPQLNPVALAGAIDTEYQPLHLDLPPPYPGELTIPISGAEGYQPQLDQIAPAGAIWIDLPPPYEQRPYMTYI